MFVDDEQHVLRAIDRMFLEREDVTCLFASSGREGLELLRNEQVAVVVSDHLMPDMHGTEFLSRVKDAYPDTVRIIMTAFADVSMAIDAINRCEAYRFVSKPWEPREFVALVDEALTRYRMIQSLASREETVYLSLAQAVELKDPYTKGHCDRVAAYAVQLARAAGLDEEMTTDIRHGSWLHDCGKIGVPEWVLNHPDKLSESDFEIIMQHPRWGSEVARLAHMSETVINIIMHHHERYDGTGYPVGLAGDRIPIEARIVTIADVFDALYSDRPYRKAYDFASALEIMDSMTVTHLDPELMRLFLPIAEEVRSNV